MKPTRPVRLPPMEQPAAFDALRQPSYIDLNLGILKNPVMSSRYMYHTLDPICNLPPRPTTAWLDAIEPIMPKFIK